jgi:FkbM family methyltransferase
MEVEVLKEVALAGVYDATLPAGSVVLDVGMNTGITSLWLARQATVTRVYGYEPMPELFAQAQRQFAQNPVLADKICPQPFGLAAGARSAVFAYAPAYGVYSSEFFAPPTEQSTSVHTALHSIGEEMARITAWHPEAPLVLKLDAEGAEYELIPALAEGGWLSRFAYLMIEWHQRGPEPLLVLLEGAGFHTLQRQASPERGMIYALGPGHFPLPLFEASLHETY